MSPCTFCGRTVKEKSVLFTFHLRLAYCLLKFSRLTTDSLLTMACLEFRGCRHTPRGDTAERPSVVLTSNIQISAICYKQQTQSKIRIYFGV